MWRLFQLAVLLLVAGAANALQAPATFTFGTAQGEVILSSAGWLDADRFWFVARVAGANDLPFTGSACAETTAINPPACTVWGVADARAGRLLSLSGQDGLAPSKAALVGDKLFIAGTASQPLPPLANSPIAQAGSPFYLLKVSPTGAVESGSYLPSEFQTFDIFSFAGDVILAGRAACPTCVGERPTRLLRLDISLVTLRYDRVLPGSLGSSFGHVVDDRGQIHLAVRGSHLPTTAASAFSMIPTGNSFRSSHDGGIALINAESGELVYASYLNVVGYPKLEWDPVRKVVWVLGSTMDPAYPLTAGAVDTTFCEGSGCVVAGCILVTGSDCNYPQETVLLRLASDGGSLEYASYVGGAESDHARAVYADEDGGLTVLSVAGRIGFYMSGDGGGPRELTRVYPESRSLYPLQRPVEARWSASSYLATRDRDHGDLHIRLRTSTMAAGLPVAHLVPACDGLTNEGFRKCVSILWLPNLGDDPAEPRLIPGPDGRALLVLAVLLVVAGTLWRSRQRLRLTS